MPVVSSTRPVAISPAGPDQTFTSQSTYWASYVPWVTRLFFG